MSGPLRPGTVVLVAGTGTEVGKTWVSVQLLERWRALGLAVAARKPAESGAADAAPADSELLAAASGEARDTVCPPAHRFPLEMAPPIAAVALGRPALLLADLVRALSWPPGVDVGLVEVAGGVRSPQADDGDALDLARWLDPDVVAVVADAGLGVLNALRLTLGALRTARRANQRPPVVALNRYDQSNDVHRRNREWLVEREGVDVFVIGVDGSGSELDALATAVLEPGRLGR